MAAPTRLRRSTSPEAHPGIRTDSSGGLGGGASGTGGAAGAPDAGTGPRDATASVDAGPRVVPGRGTCALPPAASDAALQAAYARWKTDLVTSDGAGGFQRVKRPNSGNPFNSSNSEGIGYGMIAAVYLDDQSLFDKLWKYEQQWILDSHGLMNWYINPTGTAASGTGAATDGDEDMAFALVMADKQWGGKGSLETTYLDAAKKQIGAIWQHEVDPQ